MSRDVPEKHHPEDIELYKKWAREGFRIRIMGGTCLSSWLGGISGIELLPSGAEDAAEFLRGLDCFYYRPSPKFLEAYGRVVSEAMATGLPVVCGRPGGYEDMIQHGSTGFLFDQSEEADRCIGLLKQDENLRRRMGEAARESMELIHEQEMAKRREFYLR